MNYFEEPGLGMQREYGQGMPFYLTYPMTNLYQTEKEYVEEECDKMEYEGSIMYDEYPDKVLLYRTAAEIYDKTAPVQGTERRDKGRDRDLMDVIQVLLYDEIHRRRGRRRRCCRRWW